MATDEISATERSAAAKLFDIRLLIGGLFVVYGLMLSVDGLFFVTAAELEKAAGLNINLWLGLGMLGLGLLFLLWRRLSPTPAAEPNPTGVDSADVGRGH